MLLLATVLPIAERAAVLADVCRSIRDLVRESRGTLLLKASQVAASPTEQERLRDEGIAELAEQKPSQERLAQIRQACQGPYLDDSEADRGRWWP